MKILLFAVTILMLFVVTTLSFMNIDGSVILDTAGKSRQLPLVMVIGGILLFYLLLSFLFWAFSSLRGAPGAFGRKRKRGKHKKSRASLKRGIIEMTEGKWAKAERSLTSSAAGSDLPLLNYLAAARVAQAQGKTEQRDQYLAKADEVDAEEGLAVALTRAELLNSSGEFDEAMATLASINDKHPGNERAQKYLAKTLSERAAWQELAELLPALEKNKSINQEELTQLNINTYGALLKQHGQAHEREAFDSVWKRIPKKHKAQADLAKTYIRQLIHFDDAKTAGPFIRKYLKSSWDDDIVSMYSELDVGDHKVGLAQTEKWLKRHPESAGLLATAGFLNAKAELWGKAKSQLEQSLVLKPSTQSYKLLGDVLLKMGEQDAALESYNHGLKLAVDAQIG